MEINKEIKNAFGSNLQGSNSRETKITVMIAVVVILFFICNITETTVFMLRDKIAHRPLIVHFVVCINSSVNSLVYIWYFQQPISNNISGSTLLQKEKQ